MKQALIFTLIFALQIPLYAEAQSASLDAAISVSKPSATESFDPQFTALMNDLAAQTRELRHNFESQQLQDTQVQEIIGLLQAQVELATEEITSNESLSKAELKRAQAIFLQIQEVASLINENTQQS